MRIHDLMPASVGNGPGKRAVIWTQGCSLRCPGCFNPKTHSFAGGWLADTDALFRWIAARQQAVEGLTVSGGEPLDQRQELLPLLARVRQETSLSVLLFTGYQWQEVQAFPESAALLAQVDVLIAGRYDRGLRLAEDLRGSANKTLHFLSKRYTNRDLVGIPIGEIVITAVGEVVVSGIDPPGLVFRRRRGRRSHVL